MKKTMALLLALVMIFAGAEMTFASSSESNVIFTLAGYGIIDADATAEGNVTRGEFANMIAGLLGFEKDELPSVKTPYLDVPEDYEYAGDIALLTDFGILNGVSETSFAPNELLTYEQAVKVLVVITGYGDMAIKNGGWPSGYITIASRNGMLGGVSLENPFERKSLYRLIYNTLDVNLIDEVIKRDLSSVLVKTGDTLRNQLETESGSRIFRHTGVVVANSFTYITAPYSDLYDDEVVIEDENEKNSFIFRIGSTNAFDMVGNRVDFYFRETESGYELLSIRPAISNEVIKVNATDFGVKSGNTVSFTNEKGKNETITLDGDYKVTYNGTRVLSPGEDIFDIKDGYISFYNNDSDADFELAMVWEYENAIATAFDGEKFDFAMDARYKGYSALFVDSEDKDIKMVVRDGKGNRIESFEGERIVSISENKDSTRYNIFVSDDIREGAFESFGEDTITLDGIDYVASESLGNDISLGENYIIYINYEGKIAFVKQKDTKNYAYVLEYGSGGGSSLVGKISAKLIVPGKVDDGVVINEEDVTDTSRVPYLILQNEGTQIFDFAETVRCQGEKFTGKNLLQLLGEDEMKVISYELNAQGEICEITPLEKFGGDVNDRYQYNVYDRVFGGTTVDQTSGFAINNLTKVTCVPIDDKNNILTDASDDDLAMKVNITVANNDVGYRVEGYDYDETTKKVRFLVAHASMNSTLVPSMNVFGSRACVVTSVKYAFDDETGENEQVITLLNGAEEKILRPIEISSENKDIEKIKKGDLIVYTTNNNDNITNAFVVQSIPKLSNEFISDSTSTSIKRTFGRAGRIEFDEIDTYNRNLITKLEVYVGDAQYPVTYSIPQTNKPPVYIYNRAEQSFKYGTMQDIRPDGEQIYIFERRGDALVRALVLVR